MSGAKTNTDRLDVSERVLSAWEAMGGASETPAGSLNMIADELRILGGLRDLDPDRVANLLERYAAISRDLRTRLN